MFKDVSERENLFFVGDIHGQWDALLFAYKQLGITGADLLVSVGDVIDRGDKSLECLNFFLTASNAMMVKGNHEDMFIKGLVDKDTYMHNNHLFNGGGWVLGYPKTYVDSVAFAARDLPLSLTLKHGNKTFGVCHAECPTDTWGEFEASISSSVIEDGLWGRNKIEDPKYKDQVIPDVDWTIHGHTPRPDVTAVGNQLFIDTGGQAISMDRGLTFLQWDGEEFTKHTVNYDPLESGYVINSRSFNEVV